jgi:predicted Zn-dependent protease
MTTDLDLASRVLDLVRAASPTAEAEVTIDRTEQALTRFARSFIHQNMTDSGLSVRLRLHDGGRTASGTTTSTDADGLRALVDRTAGAARLCPPDPQWPGLTPPTQARAAAAVDEQTAYADPAARAQRVRAFVDAAGGLETAGYCATIRVDVTFANSAGQTAHAQAAEAAITGIARSPDGDRAPADGVARLATARLADIDGAVLGARAAAKASAGVKPVELPPGRYEVVLEPTAVYDLLVNIAMYGFNAKAIAERQSFVELDRVQFDPALTMVDDPLESGIPFDVEGTPRGRLTVVDAGVTTAVAHDRRTAAAAGVASSGHAVPGGGASGGIFGDLRLLPDASRPSIGGEADGPAADADVAALVSQVGRGLLVSDLWYTRILDPRTLVVTGLTRNGVWLIEDGQIVGPVQNLRFTQSYPDALAPGAVLGIGTRALALPAEWGVMTYQAPALRLAAWNCTGNASG